MPSSDFDIYQTDSSYVAVTNAVRRQILNALSKRERQLPELVKLTKKAKPTLSSVHMRELLAQRLVEEVEHPTDKRKKIYRLKGRRIGSSSLPVEHLRRAVREYASRAPGAPSLTLAAALDALAAAPDAPPDALRRQAARLGTLAKDLLPEPSPTALAQLLDREGVARPLRIDLENGVLEVAPAWRDERSPALLGGLVEGLLARAPVATERAGPGRVSLRLPGAG